MRSISSPAPATRQALPRKRSSGSLRSELGYPVSGLRDKLQAIVGRFGKGTKR